MRGARTGPDALIIHLSGTGLIYFHRWVEILVSYHSSTGKNALPLLESSSDRLKRQQFPKLLELNSTRSLHRMKIFSPEAYSWSTWPREQPARASLRLLCSPANMHQTTNYHWSEPPAPSPGPPQAHPGLLLLTPRLCGPRPNVHFCGRVRARQSRASLPSRMNLKWPNLRSRRWFHLLPAALLSLGHFPLLTESLLISINFPPLSW